jgi:DNA-binding SARP family transcriptional activator/predicted ATPase
VSSLQLYFLGRLDMRSGGRPLPRPPTLKSQSLLAYLVLHRDQVQPRERIIGLFWSERPERKARGSLSTALWHIRRCLPDDSLLLSDAHAVQFDPESDVWLDVEEFEAQVSLTDMDGLQSALALYRGDLLEGFYDDWILPERYRLEVLYVDALARLMAAYEAAGDYGSALTTAQRMLGRDLLREDAHRLAMRAYCRLGRRNAALEQYERCREIVLKELGAEPTGETTALYQAILGGDFPVGPTAATLPAEVPSIVPADRAGRSPLDVIAPVRLVGRERELKLLLDAWQAARTGHGELLLVSGEAGVGKTRLVEEFANELRWQGVRVLSGRCYEFERALPYQPLAEALQVALQVLSDDELKAFPAWSLREVSRLVPELQERPALGTDQGPAVGQIFVGDRADAWPATNSLGPNQEQMRLFAGVTRVLAGLSSRAPLLLVLEDLHWAGESTLGLVHHLARYLAGHPVLIVGTFRAEAIGVEQPLRTLRRRLARERLARSARLARLPTEAVETIIVEMSGAGDAAVPLARRLYRETEGNPFFLMEIVKALFETDMIRLEEGAWRGDFAQISAGTLPLPPSLSETIEARVRRLEASARDALHLAAVLGREFSFDLLDLAWGRGEEATLVALDDLLRQRLVEETVAVSDTDFAFTHHKIREVVYQSSPRSRRLHLHAQAGTAIETLYAAELQARAGELAHHFERACLADRSLCDKAVAYLLQAGQHAVRQSANLEAIAYYRRGLEILRTLSETGQRVQREIELQIALGVPTTVVHGYASPEARRVYDRARDLCGDLGQTPALVTSLVGVSRYYGVGGDVETGLEIAEQLLAIARTVQDHTFLIEAYRQMAGHLFSLGRLKEARTCCERGLALYDVAQHESHAYRFGHDPAATCFSLLSMTLWLLGYPDQARAQSQNLRDLALSMTHASSRAYAYCFLAVQACMGHDVPGARDDAEAAIDLGQRHGLPVWTAMAMALRGWALIQQRQEMQGLARLQDGTAAFRATGFAHFTPFFLGLQAEACLQMAVLEDAAATLSAACAIVHNGADRFWMAELHRLAGELVRAGAQDDSEADAHFRLAIDTARGQEAKMLELRATTSLARLWRDQGRCQDARQVLSRVYDRFDEGFHAYDLLAAAALLKTLV